MVDLTGSEWYLGEAPIYPAFIFTGWIGTAWLLLLAEFGLGGCGGGGVRALEDPAAAVACRT